MCRRLLGSSEVILGRDLPAYELEICWEIPAWNTASHFGHILISLSGPIDLPHIRFAEAFTEVASMTNPLQHMKDGWYTSRLIPSVRARDVSKGRR